MERSEVAHGMRIDWDVPIPMEDGLVLRADVFRPLAEGKYHQVKRMMAAVGNHVARLHRTEIGQYIMPKDLAEGEWHWLYPDDLQKLSQSVGAPIV